MLQKLLKATADQIRAVIADEDTYPYDEDALDQTEKIIASQAPEIAALLQAFVDAFRPVYSSSEYMTQAKAFDEVLQRTEHQSNEEYEYLCAVQITIDRGLENTQEEILDKVGLGTNGLRGQKLVYKPR